jgi:CheY-like chemotaxis protein
MNTQQEAMPTTSANILVAEDNVLSAMDTQQWLGKAGYRAAGFCTNSESAVRKAGELKVDLVLMNIKFEGKATGGIEAARQLRLLHNIPVIFLSAGSDANAVAQAQLTERYGCLAKPLDERTLRTTIENGLQKHKTECEHKELA